MALIKCPECNKEISDKAKHCPHCGYPIIADSVVQFSSTVNLNNDEKFNKESELNEDVLNSEEIIDENKYSENEDKHKINKNKKNLTVLIIIFIIASLGGYFIYSDIQEKKKIEESYNYTVEFSKSVVESAIKIEDVNKEVLLQWSYFLKGYYYSLQSAMDEAKNNEATNLSSLESENAVIQIYYLLAMIIPEPKDEYLQKRNIAIDAVNDAYIKLYDTVISHEGDYIDYSNSFEKANRNLAEKIEVLLTFIK